MRKIGMNKINPHLCKGCDICIEFCPKRVYEKSETVNKGVRMPYPKNQEKCTKCNLCALMCPDQAIKVDETDE